MTTLPTSPLQSSPPATVGVEKQSGNTQELGRSVLPWLVAAVLILALIPRLHRLGDTSLRFDEGFSSKMISFDFLEIWDRTSRDVHPPLYYWLLKGWASVGGDSPVALRSMSVLFGVVTVYGIFLFVREAEHGFRQSKGPQSPELGEGIALLAAALLALSPFHIAWAQQARMYTLGAALAAFSSWFLLLALRPGPPRAANWVGYVSLAVALLYTHVFGLFTIAAQALFAFGVGVCRGWSSKSSDRWSTLTVVLIVFFAIEICWLPWLGEFLEQQQRVAASYWIPPFHWEQVSKVASQLLTVSERGLSHSSQFGWMAALFCLVSTVAVLLFGRPGQRLLALGFLLPVATTIVVSHFIQNVLITRYLLFAHVSLIGVVAVVTGHVLTRPARVVASGGLLLAASIVCLQHMELREKQARLPGLSGAMEYLDAQRKPEEPILTGNPMVHAAVLSHINNPKSAYVISGGREFPHFQGAPVMREEEYLGPGQLTTIRDQSIWVVEAIKWDGGTWTVTMPEPWVSTQEARFSELYRPACEIVIRRYERLERHSFSSLKNGKHE